MLETGQRKSWNMTDADKRMTSGPAKAAEASGGVQVIARAAKVLRALDGEPLGLTLTQLAGRVRLPRSTVHRIVTALVAEGFLASVSPSSRFRIGPEFARLAAAAGTAELWLPVEPYMMRLADQLGETVDCAILDRGRVRVIHVIPTERHTLRAVAEVGQTFPVYSSAKGKALLAEFDSETAARMLPAAFDSFTPYTLTSAGAIAADLEQVRETGIAYDREETTLGVHAAAIALPLPSGTRVAISVIVPSQRYGALEGQILGALADVRRQSRRAPRTPAP
jgi:IclR family transcriptional regulator, carbohydrate utilization repressor